MRATRAYITSFGTTGLLIASALLTLSVMSAFVAFRGFPGEDVQAPIQSLLVQEHQTPVPVPAKPVRVGVLADRRAPAAGAGHGTATRRVTSPTASTGPVVHRTAPAPAPTQAPSTGTSSGTATPVATTVPITSPTTTPSVPSTSTVPLPTLTVPSLPPPPSDSSLPVDTSGITGLLGG